MAGHNTSSAYNLDAFDQPQKREKPAPELKVIKNRRQIASAAFSPRVLSAFVIVITLVSLMVYNRVQLTELTGEINSLAREMEQLQNQNTTMSAEMESAIDMQSIKKLAGELGMQPRSEYQTELILLYQEDKIERTQAAPESTAAESAKLAVTSFFSRFKEYMADR